MENQTIKARTLTRIREKSAIIGVFGLGYVGLPLALCYAESGFRVVGFDTDPEKIAKLEAGETYIEHIDAAAIRAARDGGLVATDDFSRAAEVDALILCVPTPLDKHRAPDLGFVTGTVDRIVPHLCAGQVLSLESTTWPGTTEEELLPRVEAGGLVVGEGLFLIYSPERQDPGNPDFGVRSIPKLVGGHTDACFEVGAALYGAAVDRVVPLSSTRAAEMVKLLENIHRAVNIGLVNEMKMVCDRMDIDIHEVIRAAATKPFGFTPYYPGPGYGGHCIPIDPFYLTWKAREYGLNPRFIELAGEVNTAMPGWVIEKVVGALNDRGRAVAGSRVLMLGVAYKKDVDDIRESPAVKLMELLRDRGALIDYTDPHVPVFPTMREHHFDLVSVAVTPAGIAGYDLVLLATDHTGFDYEMIRKSAQLIVDTRGVYVGVHDNVVKA